MLRETVSNSKFVFYFHKSPWIQNTTQSLFSELAINVYIYIIYTIPQIVEYFEVYISGIIFSQFKN